MDLNACVTCPDRAQAHVHRQAEVWFQDISARLQHLLGGTPYVVGAMAWFHDREVLRAMQSCRGVSFVVTSERGMGRYHHARFGSLPQYHARDASAVRAIGRATGRRRALMHHKFLVGLNDQKEAAWVLTGSYNATVHSRGSLENVLLLRDPDVAATYFREYERLYAKSRKVTAPKT
jgi:phosphatidylserine/phosphatidylglycerophosphate/cardiolipin synthase-like enzyme